MHKPSICIISPAEASANNGNWQTAWRWSRMLAAHYGTGILQAWHGEPFDVLLALHARRSAPAIRRALVSRSAPGPAAGRGADRHRPVPGHRPLRRRSAPWRWPSGWWCCRTWGAQDLPPPRAPRPRHLPVDAPAAAGRSRRSHLRPVMVGHLRQAKAPQTLFAAARLLAGEAHPHRPHRRRRWSPRLGRRGARRARLPALHLARRPAARRDPASGSARPRAGPHQRARGRRPRDHGSGAAGTPVLASRVAGQRRHARAPTTRATSTPATPRAWRGCSRLPRRAGSKTRPACWPARRTMRAARPAVRPPSANGRHCCALSTNSGFPMNAPLPGSATEPRLTSLSHGGGCGCKIAPGVLSESSRARRACRCRRTAGRHRDRRRRRRLPAQRRAGAGRHHRLLHADRRRPVRLRPHRRDQRDLRRLRHGRPSRSWRWPWSACRSTCCPPRPSAASWKAASRSAGGRHPDRRRPHHRLGRADLRPGGAGPGAPGPRQAQRRRPAGRRAGAGQAAGRGHPVGGAEEGKARCRRLRAG